MNESRTRVWVQRFADRTALVLQWFDRNSGRRKSKSTGTTDHDTAEQLRSDLEYELNNGKYQESSRIDWEPFRQLFETEHVAGLREKTREKYQTVLDVFEQTVGPKKLRSIDERVISAFVVGMRQRKRPGKKVGLAPMTIRNYLISLKTALGWAVEQKFLPAVPNFPTIKVPRKKPQPIPTESFHKLMQHAPDKLWRAYLLCAWWGGLRLDEARHLRWQPSEALPWLDLQGNRIVLPAVFAKSAQDQSVPLAPTLRKALAQLPAESDWVFPFISRKGGGRLSGCGVSQRVRDMAKRAGVKLSMHQLRKGFGCRVAKQLGKGNAPLLHELMRHSSMQITMDYYANVDDVLQDAIRQLK